MKLEKDKFYDRQSTIIPENNRKNINESSVLIYNINPLTTELSKNLCLKGFNIDIYDKNYVKEEDIYQDFIYFKKDIGRRKSDVLKEFLKSINEYISINILTDNFYDSLNDSNYLFIVASLNDIKFYLNLEEKINKYNINYIFCHTIFNKGFYFIKLKDNYKQLLWSHKKKYIINYNCYSFKKLINIDEKNINWYFNKSRLEFSPCNSIFGSLISQTILNSILNLTKFKINYSKFDCFKAEINNFNFGEDQIIEELIV